MAWIAVSSIRPGPIVENRRVAALYDIHGNLPALEAVVDEVRQAGVDSVVVGGDVLPGPMARESLELLRSLDVPVQFIHGNGDREALALLDGEPTSVPELFRESVRWSAEQLLPGQQRLVASWPSTVRLDISGMGAVLFCHATPRNDTEIFTRLTADDRLLPVFGDLDAALVVCGHTHMQFDRMLGRLRIVNAGSVGMPFGEAGADWLFSALRSSFGTPPTTSPRPPLASARPGIRRRRPLPSSTFCSRRPKRRCSSCSRRLN